MLLSSSRSLGTVLASIGDKNDARRVLTDVVTQCESQDFFRRMVMAILSGFFDETGHSKDRQQLFNGMAGVLAPFENWATFERSWTATLREFRLPYFHMTDFAASKGIFDGWEGNETKRRRLLSKLWTHIRATNSMPVGVSIPMKVYQSLSEEQQKLFGDPYMLGFLSVVGFSIGFMELIGLARSEKIALTFSDQVEFMNPSKALYTDSVNISRDSPSVSAAKKLCKTRTFPPIYDDMRKVVALQAADIVAYEVYKEHERLQGYRKAAEPRYGYKQIVRMSERLGYQPLVRFYSNADIAEYIDIMEAEKSRRKYWSRRG